jgi:hypothetical protein
MENLSHKSLYVTLKSNLAMQVFIFQDEKLTQPAENMFLRGYEKTIVYICLQPNLNSESYTDGHCRELVGGIRAKVHNLEHDLLYESTIKFTAVVGKSILRVSKSFIDMGATRKLGQSFTGAFSVSNLSTHLPLKYSINTSKNLKLNKHVGELEGSEGNANNDNNPRSKEKIQFVMTSTSYGLIEEKLVIINMSCNGQRHEILVRLFVDDESLLTSLPLSHTGVDWYAKFYM